MSAVNEYEGVYELFERRFDYDDAVSRSRIQARSVEELIDVITDMARVADDYEGDLIYRLNVTYSLNDENEEFRIRRFTKASLIELADRLDTWRTELIISRENSRHVMDTSPLPISYGMLYAFERNIGKGGEKTGFIYDVRTGRRFRYEFYRTIENCLLRSCGLSRRQCDRFKLNNDLAHNWRKNTKVFEEYMYKKYKKSVNVIDSIEEYEDDKVNILIRGEHAGRLYSSDNSSLNDKDIITKEIKIREYPDIEKVMFISYDIEWDWIAVKDDSYMSTAPKIITYKITKGRGEASETMVSNNFFIFMNIIKLKSSLWNSRSVGNCTYMFAHNGKQVEHRTVLKYIADYEIFEKRKPIELTNVNGTSIKTFSWAGINFRDTCLFANINLDSLGESFGLKSRKVSEVLPKDENGEPDYLNMKWDPNDPAHIEYAKKDTEVLHEFVSVFNNNIIELLGLENGKFYMTATSMSSLCKNIIVSKHDIANTNAMRSWFQTTYFGGRTEMFKWGIHDDVKVIDIVSSYPYQMTKDLPRQIVHRTKELCIQDISDTISVPTIWGGMIRCSHEDVFQLLAVRSKSSLTFPIIKNGWVFIWQNEYEAIVNNLHVHEWGDVLYFDTFTLRDFVLPIVAVKTKAKLEGNKGLAATAKITVNSSYGSLAIKEERTMFTLFHKNNPYYKGRENNPKKIYFEDEYINNNVILEKSGVFANSVVAVHVASYITASARLQLWNKFNELHNRGYTVLYSDTDSVFFKDPLNTYNNSDSSLGGWELESYRKINIVSLKQYELTHLDGETKSIKYKGVKNPKSVDAEQTTSLWKRGSLGTIFFKTLVKRSSGIYSKGIKQPNGGIDKLIWPV